MIKMKSEILIVFQKIKWSSLEVLDLDFEEQTFPISK